MPWQPADDDYDMRRRWAEMTEAQRREYARKREYWEQRRKARPPVRRRQRWVWHDPETWGVLSWTFMFIGWVVVPAWSIGVVLGWW
jgi:hypothetical protein